MNKIPNSTDIKNFISKVKNEQCKKFEDSLEELTDILKAKTPVKTGNLRDSWGKPQKIGNCVYKLSNNADYGYKILIEGGSPQLPLGILPTIRKWSKEQ